MCKRAMRRIWPLALAVFLPLSIAACDRGTGPTEAGTATSVIDFDLPLETGPGTMVCPVDILFDRREGHGLKAAYAAVSSIFGQEEAVTKVGCELWREGQQIHLSDEARHDAKQGQANQRCPMVRFGLDKLILSCALRNDPSVPPELR